MNLSHTSQSVDALVRCRLLSPQEADYARKLGAADSPVAKQMALAETVHLHIKVDDTHELPVNEFFDAGARLDHQKDGFVKYRFPGGLNAIFSHISVSQDDLAETDCSRRPRPFVDHIGIDMRQATEPVRAAFEMLPELAEQRGWGHVAQGGPEGGVQCCHTEVESKHWLYPSCRSDHPAAPLEFAYGPLKVTPGKSGCDLRPSNPANGLSAAACCGGAVPIALQK